MGKKVEGFRIAKEPKGETYDRQTVSSGRVLRRPSRYRRVSARMGRALNARRRSPDRLAAVRRCLILAVG